MDMELHSIRPDVLIPGALVEHWRVLENLGQRGHGALYRVEDARCPSGSLVMRVSLRAGEGRVTDKGPRPMSAHPNVGRLHGFGRWPHPADGFFFFVRDEVPGQSLPSWLETANPSFLQITALLGRLASALDDVHARDTWHRELHPDHIQVREGDAEPVLLDLRAGGDESLATLLQQPLPHDTQVFRSPESLRFLRMNLGRPRARYRFLPTDDLYALGAIAYWMVTGYPPFSPGLSLEQLHTEIELRAPPLPWELNERCPKPLGAIIMRLMSKLPEARPHSGESLSAELAVAVSAGARSMWAKRVFDWEHDAGGAEASPRRVRRPAPPAVCSQPGPKLPRVVYFSSPTERLALASQEPPSRTRKLGAGLSEPMGPWSRMM